jgi:hypothetical protein
MMFTIRLYVQVDKIMKLIAAASVKIIPSILSYTFLSFALPE